MANNKSLNGESFNFGPNDNQIKTVKNVVNAVYKYVPKNSIKINRRFNRINEHNYLKLNCDKALALLNWSAVMDFEDTVKMTAKWYSDFYTDQSNRTVSL